MKKVLIYLSTAMIIAFTSCTKVTSDPDLASKVSGDYTMKTYVTETGSSTPSSADKIRVTKKNDTHVVVVIDYANASSNDVTLDNMLVSLSGTEYTLKQSFSNAEASSTVNGNNMTFDMTYTSGAFAKITATK